MEKQLRSLEQELRVLGLQPGATLAEVEQAYQELADAWHPDRLPDVPGLKKSARKKRKEIEGAAATVREWHARALSNSSGGGLSASGSRASLFEDIFTNASKSARRPAWILGGAVALLALILGFVLPWGKPRSVTPLPDSPSEPLIPAAASDSSPTESSQTLTEASPAANPRVASPDAPASEEIEPPQKPPPPPAEHPRNKPRLIRKN